MSTEPVHSAQPPASRRSAGKPLRLWARAALVGWVPLVVVPSTYMIGFHLLGLPTSTDSPALVAAALDASRSESERGAWLAIHVLSSRCGCSRRIAAHLVERGSRGDLRERVELVGDDDGLAKNLERAGFVVERLSPEELERRYHLNAAPELLVLQPAGALAYVGGYGARKQSPIIDDGEVLDALVAGRSIEPFPVLGCALGRDLKQKSDPLGLED